ncbi:hypothetical protein CNY89_03780, partial [Amaricoccus sp. HAR-UPW-R2A-40]
TDLHRRQFADVELTHMLADAGGMQLVRKPKQFERDRDLPPATDWTGAAPPAAQAGGRGTGRNSFTPVEIRCTYS